MAEVAEIRAWLRDNDYEPPAKGRIPGEMMTAYTDAHPAGGEALFAGLDAAPAYDGGITADDFAAEPGEPLPPAAQERKPRRVKTPARTQARGLRERIWGGGGTGKPKPKKTAVPRISLKNFAEDAFLDLAWTFQGLPPVEKILYLQAPLAGQVVEDTVKGTAVDLVLQPVARIDRQFKAIEALTAPLWVAGIMLAGEREAVTRDPESGEVSGGDYTARTKLMFGGLRHALLSMSRVTDLRFEELRAKSTELKAASGEIDAMMEWLFEVPGAPQAAPEPEPAMAGSVA